MSFRSIGLRHAAFIALSLAVLSGGCATAQPLQSSRQGLLNRMAAAESTYAQGKVDSHGGKVRGATAVVAGQLKWPLSAIEVSSKFGRRGREFHEGIDLRAKIGTAVYAAQEGTVVFSGSKIRGYGRMIVIRHQRELSTVYAHNSRLLVRQGQYVRQGQKIAISGNTGHSFGPHLHFEVRKGLVALNPAEYLPTVLAASDFPVRSPAKLLAANPRKK